MGGMGRLGRIGGSLGRGLGRRRRGLGDLAGAFLGEEDFYVKFAAVAEGVGQPLFHETLDLPAGDLADEGDVFAGAGAQGGGEAALEAVAHGFVVLPDVSLEGVKGELGEVGRGGAWLERRRIGGDDSVGLAEFPRGIEVEVVAVFHGDVGLHDDAGQRHEAPDEAVAFLAPEGFVLIEGGDLEAGEAGELDRGAEEFLADGQALEALCHVGSLVAEFLHEGGGFGRGAGCLVEHPEAGAEGHGGQAKHCGGPRPVAPGRGCRRR